MLAEIKNVFLEFYDRFITLDWVRKILLGWLALTFLFFVIDVINLQFGFMFLDCCLFRCLFPALLFCFHSHSKIKVP